MKTIKALKTICIMGLMAAVMFALPACNSNTDGLTGGVAATVNGVEIMEDDITIYAKNIRTSNQLTEDSAWGEYLASSGSSPEKFREDAIGMFVDKELITMALKDNNVSVDESEVTSRIDTMKKNYENEEAWQSALEQSGLTDESYREAVTQRLEEMELMEKVAPLKDPKDAEVLEYLQTNKDALNGAKRSSHILFDAEDKTLATEVLAKIKSGELAFADAVKEYSKDTASAEQGGDISWDIISGGLVEAYQTALDGLEEGKMSELVESEYGFHIILCTAAFTAPEEITSFDQVPTEFVDASKSNVPQVKQGEDYEKWFEKYKEEADIVINPIPAKVPYNIDMTPFWQEIVELYDEELGSLSDKERSGYYDQMGIPADIYNNFGVKHKDYKAQNNNITEEPEEVPLDQNSGAAETDAAPSDAAAVDAEANPGAEGGEIATP